MFTYFAVPKTLLKQGVYGLWRIGEGVERPAIAQVRKLQWGSGLGAGTSDISVGGKCCLRGFGSQARGLRKNGAKCIPDEGFKEKTPQKKKRSVKVNGTGGESTRADAADEVSRENCGRIHLIVGPMFAGKSTALLRRVQEEASRGRKVALVKSDKDTRYGASSIVTHDGLQMPCYAVPDLATFKSKVGGNSYKELDVIGIDEAQFFIDLYEFCQSAADFEDKTLIVAGLDGDFLRRKFGSTLDLVPIADSIVKLSSRCEICGRPANFSFRKTLDTRTELVGGSEIYMPVCRQHFVNGQIVVETASTVIGDHQVSQISKD